MARIDHTGHNHPATPAARAECRKIMARNVEAMGPSAAAPIATPAPVADRRTRNAEIKHRGLMASKIMMDAEYRRRGV